MKNIDLVRVKKVILASFEQVEHFVNKHETLAKFENKYLVWLCCLIIFLDTTERKYGNITLLISTRTVSNCS